jgi:hypothetical protein
MDQAKFIKLMNLTASENDHEALLALRTASKLMREAGISWTNLIFKKEERTRSIKIKTSQI